VHATLLTLYVSSSSLLSPPLNSATIQDSKLKSLTRMLPSLPGARPASTTPPATGTVNGSATSSAKWFLLLAIGVATVVLTTQKNDKQAELLEWIRKVVFRQ